MISHGTPETGETITCLNGNLVGTSNNGTQTSTVENQEPMANIGSNAKDILAQRFFKKNQFMRRGSLGSIKQIKLANNSESSSSATKRGREDDDDSASDSHDKDFQETLAKLVKTSKSLMQLLKNTPNTKGEIKTAAKYIDQLVSVLEAKNIESRECQRANKMRMIKKDTRDVAVQTNLEEENDSGEMSKIYDKIQNGKTFEEIADRLDKEWPEEIFRTTTEVADSSINDSIEGDLAIIIDPKNKERDKLVERLKIKYPGLDDIINDSDGNVEYIISTIKTVTNRRENNETKALYLIPYNIDKDGMNDIQEMYKQFIELRNVAKIYSTKRMVVAMAEGIDRLYTRKLLEYVFRKTDIKVEILVPKEALKFSSKSRKREPIERLTIKSGEKSYADLLKTIKKNVDIDKIGVNVKNIRKTTQGDLLLEVSGGNGKANSLKDAIKDKVKNIEVKMRKQEKVFHILGIDAATSIEEVEEALTNAIEPIKEDQPKVLSLRPNRGGGKSATVSARKDVATDLIRRGRIRIGWLNCKIQERVFIIRCFKCLEFGHKMNECKGEDRGEICWNCGKNDHKLKECRNEPYCLHCKCDGHRADQTKCPRFRELLREKSALQRQNMGSRRHGSVSGALH